MNVFVDDLLREIGGRIAAQSGEAYFVGGCVRDLLRGEPIHDVDLALAGDTHAAGRMLANRYEGHVFWLRQDDEVVRVRLPQQGELQIDLCPLRGTLEEDLRARDLTINAMAVPANQGLGPGVPIIDLTGGREDLSDRCIRFVTPEAPVSDPLRTLRALRFRWKLGFELADDTRSRVRECVPLLKQTSVERVRDELFQLLAIPMAAEALAECLEVGMGRWLFGKEIAVPETDGVAAPADAVQKVLSYLPEAPVELDDLLKEIVTPPRSRREVLLWAAALLPLVGTIDPSEAARYLALSNDERTLISRGLATARAVPELLHRWPVPGRDRYRLLRQAAPAGAESVLLSAIGSGLTSAHRDLLEEALRRHYWPEAPLLTGLEVMQILGAGPGPRVGRALEGIEEARADGLLRTPEDAVRWLRERVV